MWSTSFCDTTACSTFAAGTAAVCPVSGGIGAACALAASTIAPATSPALNLKRSPSFIRSCPFHELRRRHALSPSQDECSLNSSTIESAGRAKWFDCGAKVFETDVVGNSNETQQSLNPAAARHDRGTQHDDDNRGKLDVNHHRDALAPRGLHQRHLPCPDRTAP